MFLLYQREHGCHRPNICGFDIQGHFTFAANCPDPKPSILGLGNPKGEKQYSTQRPTLRKLELL